MWMSGAWLLDREVTVHSYSEIEGGYSEIEGKVEGGDLRSLRSCAWAHTHGCASVPYVYVCERAFMYHVCVCRRVLGAWKMGVGGHIVLCGRTSLCMY